MLLDVETLAKKDELTKTEIQDSFEYLYRLNYHPVAVKFFFDEEEYKNFKAEKVPGPKMTFCQIALAARFNSYIVKATEDNLLCGNAKTVFGYREPSDEEVEGHVKYTNDWDWAKECLWSKPRMPVGKLKGFAVAPLGKANFEPSVVFFVTNSLQAYHIANDYVGACKEHPLTFKHTVNSAVCAGVTGCYLDDSINMNTMCAGSYTSGKTEQTEVNVFIPGTKIYTVAKQLVKRTYDYNGPSMLGAAHQEFPGMDVCKKCPMVKFKDAE
ncbi:MAG: DUF169 domain-containing protein [Clostridiales bacterium]|nr:DUF169 domain-containing protein [Clostridiales bacterium]MCF8022960.1 DUF169 domain-containing protein [Clostridiales bacterium]